MANLTIEFEGLICHVGNANVKTHAVLVNESIHVSEIDIGTGKSIRLEQWDTVTFLGPTGSGARFSSGDTFDRRVPKLRNLIRNGPIHPDVLNARHSHAAVLAFIIYPAGTLSAPVPHVDQLTFTPRNGNPFTQCVAKGVQFVSDPFSDTQMTVIVTRRDDLANVVSATPHTIASSTIVKIKNTSASGNHFNEFLYLSQGNSIAKVTRAGTCTEAAAASTTMFTAKMEQEKDALARGQIALSPAELARARARHGNRSSINPECTNSQWP